MPTATQSSSSTALITSKQMMADPPPEFLTLQEIVITARRNLSPEVWDYIIGGADTETTVKRNRDALDRLAGAAHEYSPGEIHFEIEPALASIALLITFVAL